MPKNSKDRTLHTVKPFYSEPSGLGRGEIKINWSIEAKKGLINEAMYTIHFDQDEYMMHMRQCHISHKNHIIGSM